MYTALKAIKVQVGPGKVELRQPGDPIPEAANWPKVSSWIDSGHIKPDDATTVPRNSRQKLKPMVAAKKAAPLPPPPPAPPESDELPEEGDTRSELMAMSRREMNQFAEDNTDLDPKSYPNKTALAEAILETAE
jgi:type IV secretory pathway VirB10-like protein